MDTKLFDIIARAAQNCVQQNPVVVLGSGASVPHQIRGMVALSAYLLENLKPSGREEEDAWVLIRTALAHGDGLEEALLKVAAPPSLVSKIVALTWKAIASDDLALLSRAARGEERFPLSDLIQGLFRSVHQTVNVVTTNYDRVAEYASDLAGYIHATGFLPGLIRKREGSETISIRRGAYAARVVRIWKVHGSLDWFADAGGTAVCLPVAERLPDTFAPLIVTPGVSKYERTHDEPFRSAIQGADSALARAASFLCIGYGFRDRHIQPKIVERCRQRNVPIVILARTLTDEARNFLTRNAGRSCLALEEHENGTRVFTPEHQAGVVLSQRDLWSLERFNAVVF